MGGQDDDAIARLRSDLRHDMRDELQNALGEYDKRRAESLATAFLEHERKIAGVCEAAVKKTIASLFDIEEGEWKEWRKLLVACVEAYKRGRERGGELMMAGGKRLAELAVCGVGAGIIGWLLSLFGQHKP